jgi:cyclic pyranopterin phosphate synthase
VTTVDLLAQPLTDGFLRRIDYLRVSVTDKCNLRCVYCMPQAGLPWLQRNEILQYGEIAAIVRAAAAVGVRSIRLTGGEPLVRPALNELVAMISEVDGIHDIALSTNGMLLEEQLDGLCAAGLSRVNVSLDTLRPDRFEAIARRPGLDRVLRGIDAALERGLGVKINCVVLGGQNDDELADFAELTMRHAVAVRFIELMPVRENVDLQRDAYVSSEETLERIGAVRALQPVGGPAGNGPARYFAFEGALGCVGVISPLSHDYCDRCNRVRLTADGKLRLCLFGDHAVDLRGPLRAGASQAALSDLLRAAMAIKPERHRLRRGSAEAGLRAFSEIGG